MIQPAPPCEHLHDATCRVAGALVGDDCPVTAAACASCERQSAPRAVNSVTVSLALSHARRTRPARVAEILRDHGRWLVAPSLSARAASFAQATAHWIAAGRPVRDEAEVVRIYDEACGPCDRREATDDPDVSWCRQCGCRLGRGGQVLNKILLATEHCPLGRW